ncbi:MAG: amidohydrolase family protein [Bacteroidales bacterium]|nr:amidohydrolase family protein [Bacteroidales bacterium]
MKKFSANYVFPVNKPPIKNGIVVVDDSGTILEIIDQGEKFEEKANLEHHNGIIIPGFVNTHCHLELSYLKGKIEEKKGISEFIEGVRINREEEIERIIEAAKKWDSIMYDFGIVAVGDISNTELSFKIKAESKIFYHTFIEVFGTNQLKADEIIENANSLYRKSKEEYNLSSSLTPHAAYSLHPDLFYKLNESLQKFDIFSVHHQESLQEIELFAKMQGKLLEKIHSWGAKPETWYKTPLSSTEIILKNLPLDGHILLVHNTFTSKDEVNSTINKAKNVFWVFCPNSNIYIENQLPNPENFPQKATITIGTDSLASNNRLSVLSEIISLQEYYPQLSINKLIEYATLNGAKALKMAQTFGSIEKGKKPGLLLIENVDLQKMKLKKESCVRRLI